MYVEEETKISCPARNQAMTPQPSLYTDGNIPER